MPCIDLSKTAAPRYEKEISAGNISRSDVAPGVPDLPGFLSGASRKLTRDRLYNPTEAASPDVERRRRFNQLSYEKNPLPATAHPADAIAALKASNYPVTAENIQAVTADKQNNYNQGRIQSISRPATGEPAFIPINADVSTFRDKGEISVPRDAGRAIRGALESAPRATAATALMGLTQGIRQSTMQEPHKNNIIERVNKMRQELLPSPASVDGSLLRGMLHHEAGERNTFMRDRSGMNQFSSHFGIEPLLQEQQHMYGDTEAQEILKKYRQGYPDDAHAYAAMKRVGGTPWAPPAVGGKQHAALDKIMENYTPNIATREKELTNHMLHGITSNRLSHIPTEVPNNARGVIDVLKYMYTGKR